MTDLAHDLLEYITTNVATGGDPIDTKTDLLLTGLVDSLGVVRIVDWLEQRLDAEIDPALVILENFQTVQAMVQLADSLRA